VEQKLKEALSKNNGYMTTNELIDLGIHKNNIPGLIEKNIKKSLSWNIYEPRIYGRWMLYCKY